MTDSTDNARRTWMFCPECGSKKCRRETETWRVCSECGQDWHTDLDYTSVCQSNLRRFATRADLAPDPLRAVKVKPLEWVARADITGLHEAESPIGWYYNINEAYDGRFIYEGDPPLNPPRPPAYFPTLEAAKTAAQADYETRIRSALEPDPLADPRVKALVEALEDMVVIARNDRWDAAQTGRDMVFENARTALAALDTTGGKNE